MLTIWFRMHGIQNSEFGEGKSHSSRAFNEKNMETGTPIDFDMLRMMRLGLQL